MIEDTKNWTKQYVSSHRGECLVYLRETNVLTVRYIDSHSYLAASSGMELILKGCDALLACGGFDGVRSCIAACSRGVAEIALLADPAGMEREFRGAGGRSGRSGEDILRGLRNAAASALADVQTYAADSQSRSRAASMAQALKAGTSPERIRRDYAAGFPEGIRALLLELDDTFFVPAIRQYAPNQCVALDKERLVFTKKPVRKSKGREQFDAWMRASGLGEAELEEVYKKINRRRNIYGLLLLFPPLGILLLPFWMRAVYMTKAIRYRDMDVDFNLLTNLVWFIYGIPTLFIYPVVVGLLIKWTNWGMGIGDVRSRVMTGILAGVLVLLLVRAANIPEAVSSLFRSKPADTPPSSSQEGRLPGQEGPFPADDMQDIEPWSGEYVPVSPGGECTAGQALILLYQANGSPQVSIPNPIYAVRETDACYSAVLWAYQNGLVDEYFYPEEPCTREMAAGYLWRLAGSPIVSVKDLAYGPYTISGEAETDDGLIPMTISFSAAAISKERLPNIGGVTESLEDAMAGWSSREPWSVTMITLQPGSTIEFSADVPWIYSSSGGMTAGQPEYAAQFGGSTLDLYYDHTGLGAFWPGEAETVSGWNSPIGFRDADGHSYVVVYGCNREFSDVNSNARTQAAAWAVQEGIIDRTGEDTFSPYDPCTQEQITAFLHRAGMG